MKLIFPVFLTLTFLATPAFAGSPTPPDVRLCKEVLEFSNAGVYKSLEGLIEVTASLESHFLSLVELESDSARILSEEFSSFSVRILNVSEDNLNQIFEELHRLIKAYIAIKTDPAVSSGRISGTSVQDILEDPLKINAQTAYQLEASGISEVIFLQPVVKSLARMELEYFKKSMRALASGLVASHGQPGVVRLQDIHKDLVEVKMISGAAFRLLGCLSKGQLILKKVIKKSNENKGGSLSSYSSLCK